MNRPSVLQVGGTLYWTMRTRNPDTQVLKDADSTPTVAVRKNGSSTADSVTVTKRTSTTGIYDCSYNPASEVEGDKFTLEESATVTGTSTGSATYTANFEITIIGVERGTDSALTTLGSNAPASWLNAAAIATDAITSAKIAASALNGKGDWATVGAAMTLTSGERNSLAGVIETYIVNEGDATAVLQAVADKIAADWVAGDASPVAVAAAVRSNLATELARIDVAVSSRGTGTALDAAGVRAAVGLASANLDTQLGDVPTVAEFNARTIVSASYATATALATAQTDLTAIKGVTTKLDTGLVMDGAVWQWTVNALELAPAGAGGGGGGGGGSDHPLASNR